MNRSGVDGCAGDYDDPQNQDGDNAADRSPGVARTGDEHAGPGSSTRRAPRVESVRPI